MQQLGQSCQSCLGLVLGLVPYPTMCLLVFAAFCCGCVCNIAAADGWSGGFASMLSGFGFDVAVTGAGAAAAGTSGTYVSASVSSSATGTGTAAAAIVMCVSLCACCVC